MFPMTAEFQFQSFLDAGAKLSAAALLDYYDTLEPIPIEFMLGDWDGGVLATGHDAEQQMALVRWVGKTFHDRDNVDPMICNEPDQGRVVNPIMGTARLRMVEFRGSSTATMIYDKHPIFDHFRKITNDVVMGIMDRKRDAPLFFYLRRRGRLAS
jgi:hypothetical protein